MREPGTILDGKYEVVRSLGRGGMGEVYLARHLHLEELRVIKILRQDLATDENAQKRFLREARLATQIKHPNVAILYDFAQLPEGSFYMVWEHVEGKHLGEWLTERGYLPVLPSIELGIQALRGLEAIHASGVVHRDISPDNLMITRDRRNRFLVKIIDLGLAKNLFPDPNFEVTEAGMFMGKLKYCSPEQAEAVGGETVDLRSDLYSFALVLYEMVSGHSPFEAGTPHASVMKRLSEPPQPLTDHHPEEIPPALEQVIAQALERDRERRFPDAVSFIEALEPIAFELRQPEAAVSGGPQTRASRPSEADLPSPEEPPVDRTDESSQLSKAERLELLAQIDRAARKKSETTQILQQTEALLDEGDLEQARRLMERLEADTPRARGLEELRRRLGEKERQERERVETQERDELKRQRIQELEVLLEGYIQKGQLRLAEISLETLLDMIPFHPKRGDYEEWVKILRNEVEQDRQAEEALRAGREALAEGDFKAARKRLVEVSRHDRTERLTPAFEAEIEATERESQHTADLEQHRQRFDELLERGDASAAETELARLARLGASRLSLEMLRTRLEDVRGQRQARERQEALEGRYRKFVEARDWLRAREVAHELDESAPHSSRPAEMFTEIGRLEEIEQRRQAVEQGVDQVEALIRAGEPDQAELALSIVLRMEPGHQRRQELEKQIEELKESGL